MLNLFWKRLLNRQKVFEGIIFKIQNLELRGCQRNLKERIEKDQSRKHLTRSATKKRSTLNGNVVSAHKSMMAPKTIVFLACSPSTTTAMSITRCSWPKTIPTCNCTTTAKSMMPAPAVRPRKVTSARKVKNKESIWNGLKACWPEILFPLILFYFVFEFDLEHITANCSIPTKF